jgi:hypothetical protein
MLSLKPSKDVNKLGVTGALTLTKRPSKRKMKMTMKMTHKKKATPLEARIRKTTVDMFKQVLLFSQGAAEALYNDQMIMTLDVLHDLTDNIIKELCCAIRKPGGDGPGHQISKLSVTRLKLFCILGKTHVADLKKSEDWTDMTYDKVKTLTNQETLEDNLLDSKLPKTLAMTPNPHSAAKAFTVMLIILGKMWGIAGHPLSYVPHPSLKGPNDADMDDETEDPPPFGQPGSPYVSIDDKLCCRAPILRTDLSHTQLSASLETLKSDGPFEPSFLANMVMVYNVLHACWRKLIWWSHVKKFSKTKNRRQVYQTLHTILLGRQCVVLTESAIVIKLQSFRYEGARKNFNFDKYVNLHIEQHNQHADLQEYGVAPLAENLKTLWFQEGIRDSSLNAVKVSINANRANFTDFDSVKDAYVEFKRTDDPTNDPRTQQVASVAHGGRKGGNYPCRHDQGQGPQTSDKCQKGLVPQSEVNKQTHIVNRHYSDAKFDQLTPAEKQKLWQLRNASKTPRTGPTGCDRRRAVVSTLASSTSSGSSGKCQMEDPTAKSNQPADDQGWGRPRNHDNPCLGHQVRPHGNDN